jgi:UDP-2,3-diacylglucosamine pyrophosphatase LpxH
LNVLSGDQRIRVEHGHIYDDMFVKYPRTYNMATLLGTMTLRYVVERLPRFADRLPRVRGCATTCSPRWANGIRRARNATTTLRVSRARFPAERATFLRAALEIADRGFDAVIFRHTHRAGRSRLPNGSTYYNTGLWHTDPYFAEVDHGRVTLQPVSAISD